MAYISSNPIPVLISALALSENNEILAVYAYDFIEANPEIGGEKGFIWTVETETGYVLSGLKYIEHTVDSAPN